MTVRPVLLLVVAALIAATPAAGRPARDSESSHGVHSFHGVHPSHAGRSSHGGGHSHGADPSHGADSSHGDGAHHGHGGDASAPPARSPYAGFEARDVKALSDRQVADLRAGRGMALALPAELNGYPGPAHVLELADGLRLSPAQEASTEALFAAMQAEAKAAGESYLAAERALDRLFRDGRATPATLASATLAAAGAQAALREAHLRYHLRMMDVLTPEQVARYAVLRGYRSDPDRPGPEHRHPDR